MRVFRPQNQNGNDLVVLDNEQKINNGYLRIDSTISDESDNAVSSKAVSAHTLDSLIHITPEEKGHLKNIVDLDKIRNDLYEVPIVLGEANFGTTKDTITGIVVYNPLQHGLKPFKSFVFPNVQNSSPENFSGFVARCQLNGTGDRIQSHLVTSWTKGGELKIEFDEVIPVDETINTIQILFEDWDSENNAPEIFYDATTNTRDWFTTRSTNANSGNYPWVQAPSAYHLLDVQFIPVESFVLKKQIYTDIESLNARINAIDIENEVNPYGGVDVGDGGLDTICGIELKSLLFNPIPNNFNVISFNDPRNSVDGVEIYAHVYFNNVLAATSLPVTQWTEGKPLRFYFTETVTKGTGPIRVKLSPSKTNGDIMPDMRQALVVHAGEGNRPNANICKYNETTKVAAWGSSGYKGIDITFGNSKIESIQNDIQSISDKVDELYPVTRQVIGTELDGSDCHRPVSSKAVYDELNQIKAGQNLQMVSYLAAHTYGVNTVDGFEKDAVHVTTNEKRWINELNEVVRGKYTKLSDTAQYYNTLGSQLATIPFIRCEISKNETVTDLTSVIPSRFSEIVLHDVQNNSQANSSPVYLLCQIDNSKTYYSSPVKDWKTISDYYSGSRHYIHGEDLHFVFSENIEITSDTSNVVFALVSSENDEIDQTIDKTKAPQIKLDPTDNTGSLPWFSIYNPQDVVSTSLNDMEHRAINMSFVDTSSASIKNELETLSHLVDSTQNDIYALDEAIRNLGSEVDSLKPRTKSEHIIDNDNGITEQQPEYRQIILNKKHFEECEGITTISIQLASNTEPTNKDELYLGVGKCQLNGNISEIIAYSKNKARQFQGGTLNFEFDRFTIDADTQYISLCLYEQQHESGFDTTDNLKEFNVKYREVSGDDDSRLIRQENYPEGIVNGLAAITLTCEKEENISDVVSSLEGLISEVSDKADNNKKEIEQLTSDYESLSDDVYNFLGENNDDITLESIDERIKALESYSSDEPSSDVEELKEELNQHTSNKDIHFSKEEIEKYVDDKIGEINVPENIVTSDNLAQQVDSILEEKDFVTDEYVSALIEDKLRDTVSSEDVEDVVESKLEGYVKRSELSTEISDFVDVQITDKLNDYATKEELEGISESVSSIEATLDSKLEESDLEGILEPYAKKDEIEGTYATKEELGALTPLVYGSFGFPNTTSGNYNMLVAILGEKFNPKNYGKLHSISIQMGSGLPASQDGHSTNGDTYMYICKWDESTNTISDIIEVSTNSVQLVTDEIATYEFDSDVSRYADTDKICFCLHNTNDKTAENVNQNQVLIRAKVGPYNDDDSYVWSIKGSKGNYLPAFMARCEVFEGGKLQVVDYVEEHNHAVVTSNAVYKEISKVDARISELEENNTNGYPESHREKVEEIISHHLQFGRKSDFYSEHLTDAFFSDAIIPTQEIAEWVEHNFAKKGESGTNSGDGNYATKQEFDYHVGDYDTHFSIGEKSELYQEIEDLQQTVQSLQLLVTNLQSELQTAKLENISLKTWVEENFIKGKVVAEGEVPEDDDKADDFNYIIKPTED